MVQLSIQMLSIAIKLHTICHVKNKENDTCTRLETDTLGSPTDLRLQGCKINQNIIESAIFKLQMLQFFDVWQNSIIMKYFSAAKMS